ncbi:MAG: tRNA pseudouridine(55) synthase TruB [Pseudanabaenaceae cyanobacterium bins.68]|nr:tRNA pseudouridine(55) synthase TruB [Pseudanabaenaceae cyanobacterium bins.68]
MYSGFLNLNKPLGITAHDCVARVRKSLNQKQVGHSGTLDPAATGVLPIALGKATRLLRFLPPGKSYTALIEFGTTTDSDDLDGQILTRQPCPDLSLAAVEFQLEQLIGKIWQRPPSFSAIQIGGKRLYDLARSGEIVVAPLRQVEIEQIQLLNWQLGDFPRLELQIDCGSGTYIRAIARDLGAALGCGGVLAGLCRTRSNGFSLEESLTFEQIYPDQIMASDRPLAHLPEAKLEPEQTRRWLHGQVLAYPDLSFQGYKRVYNDIGEFLGIAEQRQDQLYPTVVISH